VKLALIALNEKEKKKGIPWLKKVESVKVSEAWLPQSLFSSFSHFLFQNR